MESFSPWKSPFFLPPEKEGAGEAAGRPFSLPPDLGILKPIAARRDPPRAEPFRRNRR